MSKRKSASKQAQKKLSTLKTQLYGRDESVPTRSSITHTAHLNGTYSFIAKDTPAAQIKRFANTLDTDYLKQDLKKIALLSTAAIAAQLGLLMIVNRLSF
jgi:hypothetical protein